MGKNAYPKLINPKNYTQEQFTGETIELGGSNDYKPNIGLFPDGEMLLFDLHQHAEESMHGAAYTMHTVMYRSVDGGKSWEKGKHMPINGHEPSVTVTDDGTLFVVTHALPGDHTSELDMIYVNIYRSEDRGKTFERRPITYRDFKGSTPENVLYSRNILKLDDGSLIMGITKETKDYLFKSFDNGRTWGSAPIIYHGIDFEKKNHPWGAMAEAVLFKSPSGRLMMMARVNLGKLVFDEGIPHIYKLDKDMVIDHYEGMILLESTNGGTEWTVKRGVGYPGMMYPGIVNIGGSKMLLNYTVRAVLPGCSMCVYPELGVQAVIMSEKENGDFEIDVENDLLVIDDKTNLLATQGGGFGRTVRLSDGTFITPYSYRWTDKDVIDSIINKDYMDRDKFNKMNDELGMEYPFDSYKDNEDILISIYVSSFFAALRKTRIKTEVLRWKIDI